MLSKKCQKYMSKYEERNYAPKTRKIEKSDFKQYSDRSKSGETCSSSSCNSLQQSREIQEKDVRIQPCSETILLTEQLIYIGEENESVREKDVGKTYQEGRQGIQESNQGRCETEETNLKIKGQKMKKQSLKERKHEAKETKAYEKKEDKKEAKSKKK